MIKQIRVITRKSYKDQPVKLLQERVNKYTGYVMGPTDMVESEEVGDKLILEFNIPRL